MEGEDENKESAPEAESTEEEKPAAEAESTNAE